MRKIIAIALTMLTTAPMAQTKSPTERLCEEISMAAFMIMQDRQEGEKKSEMMPLYLKGVKSDELVNVLKRLVDRVYRAPIEADSYNQFVAAENFEDQIHTECLKSPPKMVR